MNTLTFAQDLASNRAIDLAIGGFIAICSSFCTSIVLHRRDARERKWRHKVERPKDELLGWCEAISRVCAAFVVGEKLEPEIVSALGRFVRAEAAAKTVSSNEWGIADPRKAVEDLHRMVRGVLTLEREERDKAVTRIDGRCAALAQGIMKSCPS